MWQTWQNLFLLFAFVNLLFLVLVCEGIVKTYLRYRVAINRVLYRVWFEVKSRILAFAYWVARQLARLAAKLDNLALRFARHE